MGALLDVVIVSLNTSPIEISVAPGRVMLASVKVEIRIGFFLTFIVVFAVVVLLPARSVAFAVIVYWRVVFAGAFEKS